MNAFKEKCFFYAPGLSERLWFEPLEVWGNSGWPNIAMHSKWVAFTGRRAANLFCSFQCLFSHSLIEKPHETVFNKAQFPLAGRDLLWTIFLSFGPINTQKTNSM